MFSRFLFFSEKINEFLKFTYKVKYQGDSGICPFFNSEEKIMNLIQKETF